MMRHARKEFGGALNLDEMGLGKTTQAIDDVFNDVRCDNDAFNLVVTEKAVLESWAREAQDSYKEVRVRLQRLNAAYIDTFQGHRPRIMILDDTRVSFAKLWEEDYDLVVVSYAAVLSQFRKLQAYKKFIRLWRLNGKKKALETADPERLPTKRPTLSIFTSLFDLIPLRIPVKILDEAHRLKSWEGKIRNAIRAVPSVSVDLLTGTPCGNVWTDILSLGGLMPAEPLRNKSDFMKVFATRTSESRHIPLSRIDLDNLVRYFSSFSFGRGIDHLNLPGLEHEEDVEFELYDATSQRTLWLIDAFYRAARIKDDDDAIDEESMGSAMGLCTRAEQESGFPVLATYTEKRKKELENTSANVQHIQHQFWNAVSRERQKANLETVVRLRTLLH